MIRPIGRGTFRRKTNRVIGWRSPPRADVMRYESSAPVQLDPFVVAEIRELSQALGVRRASVITAACALLVRGCDVEGSEVVLDFPVSRRVRPEAQTVPGMISGVVPLVLKASPDPQLLIFVNMSTRECGKRCNISGSRCTLLRIRRVSAAPGRRRIE